MQRLSKALFLSTFLFLTSFFRNTAPPPSVLLQSLSTIKLLILPRHLAQLLLSTPVPPPYTSINSHPHHKLFCAFISKNTELKNKRPDKVLTFFHCTTYLILWQNKKKKKEVLVCLILDLPQKKKKFFSFGSCISILRSGSELLADRKERLPSDFVILLTL